MSPTLAHGSSSWASPPRTTWRRGATTRAAQTCQTRRCSTRARTIGCAPVSPPLGASHLNHCAPRPQVSFVFVCQIEGKEVEVTAPVIAPAAAPVPAARGRGPIPGAAPASRPSAPPQRPGALHPARPALAPTQPKVTPPQPSGGGEKKATPVRPVAVPLPPPPQPPKAAPAPAPPVVETMDVDDDDSEPAPHLVAAMQAPAAARRPVRGLFPPACCDVPTSHDAHIAGGGCGCRCEAAEAERLRECGHGEPGHRSHHTAGWTQRRRSCRARRHRHQVRPLDALQRRRPGAAAAAGRGCAR
jgi:hypothetical protein